MKLEELKALEQQAPMPWVFDGQFSALYGPDDMRLAEIEWIPTGPLAAALRNLAPEILALVEASIGVTEMLVPCRKSEPGVYYHGPCPICDLRNSVGAFNAKLESL